MEILVFQYTAKTIREVTVYKLIGEDNGNIWPLQEDCSQRNSSTESLRGVTALEG